MPTYDYACTACQHSFEAVQSFTDDSLTVCPECQGRLRKVFSSVGVVFKGSGFYRTDSRSSASSGGGVSGGASDGNGEKKTVKDKSDAGTSPSSEGGSKPKDTAAPGSKGAGDSGGKKAAATSSGTSSRSGSAA